MKKRVLLLAAVVALIAGAGIAYSAGSSGGGLPGGEPAVWGGGHVIWVNYPWVERDFSIVATPDGGKFVYGRLGLGQNDPGGMRVTCIRVTGNHAVIGGFRASSPDPWIWFVTDNGELAATPDQVSGVYTVTKGDSSGWSGTTKYFPYVCPPFSAMSSDVSMYDLTSGDIVVQNAVQNSQQ